MSDDRYSRSDDQYVAERKRGWSPLTTPTYNPSWEPATIDEEREAQALLDEMEELRARQEEADREAQYNYEMELEREREEEARRFRMRRGIVAPYLDDYGGE